MSSHGMSALAESSTDLTSEVSPPILPVTDGAASWTTSQGEDGEGGLGAMDDDGDMQDSDPDTTDNFDPEPDEDQTLDRDDDEDGDINYDLEAKMDELYHQLQVATKNKESAESLLEIYRSRDLANAGNNKLRNQVAHELQATIERIADINMQLDYYKQRAFDPPTFAYLPDQVLKDPQQPFAAATGRSHSNSFSTSDYADNEEDRQSIHSAIGDIISSLRSLLDSPSVRLEHLLNLVNILKQNQHIHPGYPLQDLVSCLRFCLASTVREIRLNAYRCLRLLSGTGPLGPVLTAFKIDTFVVRSLMADHRLESERIEALKLVRCFVTTKDGMQHISDGVMRAVIAIAEQADEKLRNACLETLGEMAMSDPKPVVRCGGLRAILVALTDNLQDLSDALLKVFLYLLESPETRCYVRQGLDSEMVMAVFTDIYSLGPTYLDRVKASGRIVTSMVRSWAGLFDLCANEKRAIRSLVQSIKLPIQENRKVLLDMFYEIFRIQTPMWLKEFLDGNSIKPTQEDLDSYWESNLEPLGLVDHHQSVVLTVFIDAGLIETLISLVVEDGRPEKAGNADARKVLRKATLLIPELMQLAHKVLPSHKSMHVQTLPSLFHVASNFEDPVLRHVATSAFHFIDTLCRTTTGSTTERLDDGRNQRNLDRIKQRIGTQLDEANFRSLLNDTQVLSTKDVSKWRWNLILEIIQGPMLSPRRLDEAIRGTKFSKRLLAFYRPLNHRYSNQPANESHQTYTKIGCALFETLANTAEGAKYLSQNKILRLIADGLAQLDPMQGHPASDPIFSREKMETTMTSGYFEMLGALCKSRSGSKLLEKFKIFNLYYRLSELRSRDDIVKKIITSMDYSMDGHPRVILSKVMTSGYKHIRLYATQHLGTVIKNDTNEFNDWGIRLLCTQLCDPSLDVCQMAVRALDDACSHRKNLDLLIRLRPNLDHLGEADNPLLLRFLSTSKGFQHLHDMSYIEGEMDDWFTFANRQYMIQTEVKLAKAMELQRFNPFSEDGKFENETELQLTRAKQVLTPHFYGELTRTEEGCQLLRAKGHFADYARFIREHCAECKDTAVISDLKSVLWAVGNIGSTTGGLPFLEEEDLIKYIVGMAERSKVLSLKGTCFYVLGLLCKTTQGIEILEDYGWQGILHLDKTPRGLCLPKDLDRFLEVPRWSLHKETNPPLVLPLAKEGNAVEKEILRATGELGNHILTNGASKNLAKIKAEHPAYFASLPLYSAVLELLGHYHFRLPVRRFILGLFEIKFEGNALDWLDSCGADMVDSKPVGARSPGTSGPTSNPFNGMARRSASASAVSGSTTPYHLALESSQLVDAGSRRAMTAPTLSRKNSEGGSSHSLLRLEEALDDLQPSSPTRADSIMLRGTPGERKLMQPPLPIITSALLSSPSRANIYHSGWTSPSSLDSPVIQEQADLNPGLQGPSLPNNKMQVLPPTTDSTTSNVSTSLLRNAQDGSSEDYTRIVSSLRANIMERRMNGHSDSSAASVSIPFQTEQTLDEDADGLRTPDMVSEAQSSPLRDLSSPTSTLSRPPVPPPRPPPHAYEILYTNKPYHKNFAKEAGLTPLPPRVKGMMLPLEDDEQPNYEPRRPSPAPGGGVLSGHDQLHRQSPSPHQQGTTKVIVGFNPPPPVPKALPNFANFMSSRPRRQYNAAILAAHSVTSQGPPSSEQSHSRDPVTAAGTAAATTTQMPLPDFSHLPQTRRKRPPLAPLLANARSSSQMAPCAAPTGSASTVSSLKNTEAGGLDAEGGLDSEAAAATSDAPGG
ncbi:hypothetical protein BGZ68_003305 [Mortierella alpina]|nr:hypothetical protein BGZ68_003305 [Mortierella alpina]